MPLLLALGIGMSINNGKAVLEAIFNRQSDFIRTPKYGIEKSRTDWRKSKYRALKSIAPIFEVILAIYFTYLVVSCVVSGAWSTVPFLLMFMIGFLYVSADSIRQFVSSLFARREAPETVQTV